MPLRKQRCTIVDQHTRGGFLSPTVWHVLFGAQTPKTPNKHCRVRILRHKPELVEEDILDSARHSCYGGSPNDLLRRSKNSSIPARHGKTTVISDLICSSLPVMIWQRMGCWTQFPCNAGGLHACLVQAGLSVCPTRQNNSDI